VKIASLNLADDPKDGAIAERLAVQGCRHIREESRAVVRGQRRSGALICSSWESNKWMGLSMDGDREMVGRLLRVSMRDQKTPSWVRAHGAVITSKVTADATSATMVRAKTQAFVQVGVHLRRLAKYAVSRVLATA
jgi:hypothetical protein